MSRTPDPELIEAVAKIARKVALKSYNLKGIQCFLSKCQPPIPAKEKEAIDDLLQHTRNGLCRSVAQLHNLIAILVMLAHRQQPEESPPRPAEERPPADATSSG